MSCRFKITVSDHALVLHSTEELSFATRVFDRPLQMNANDSTKLGNTGTSLVETVFTKGVRCVEIAPYRLAIKLGDLFSPADVHRLLIDFVEQQWQDAEIDGRPEDNEPGLHFVITAGPDLDDILHVLSGATRPDGNWKSLTFYGHLPGNYDPLTLSQFRPKEACAQHVRLNPMDEANRREQGLIWTLTTSTPCLIGQRHAETPFDREDLQIVTNVIIRYNSDSSFGEVLDDI